VPCLSSISLDSLSPTSCSPPPKPTR
jgi:hypothetical protein